MVEAPLNNAPVNLENKQTDLEREKWAAEIEFRRQEILIKVNEQERLNKELGFKIEEAKRSRWSSPLVLALIGTGLAALGNAGVTWLGGRDQRQLESERSSSTQTTQKANNDSQLSLEAFEAESERILEVIKPTIRIKRPSICSSF